MGPRAFPPSLLVTPLPAPPPGRVAAGVVLGAVAGHGVATIIAVLGGSILGRYLDERVVQYVGGSLFLVSAPPGLDCGPGWAGPAA